MNLLSRAELEVRRQLSSHPLAAPLVVGGVLAAAVAVGAVVAWFPDIRRYLRMKAM